MAARKPVSRAGSVAAYGLGPGPLRVIRDVCWSFQVTYRFTSDRDISGAFEPHEMVFGLSGNSVGSTKSYARCCPTITQHTPLQ